MPSTHKRRSHWFQARASWPRREADGCRLADQRRRCAAPNTQLKWESLGPTNVGGRLTCLVGHPSDGRRLWAGAAGGGVWETPDLGLTWFPRWRCEDSLNVGALAIDPNAPDTLYCGTGEANGSPDSYAGVGVYASSDGGNDWKPCVDPANDENRRLPRRIGALVVHPRRSERLLLGGVGHDWNAKPESDGPLAGLWVSRDRGANWRRLDLGTFGDAPYWCHSIVIDPREPDQIYVAVSERGARSGIWCSRDGGKRWDHPRWPTWRTSTSIGRAWRCRQATPRCSMPSRRTAGAACSASSARATRAGTGTTSGPPLRRPSAG